MPKIISSCQDSLSVNFFFAEAVKIAFQGKEQGKAIFGETTDKVISQACQDWLKQGKYRYEKSQKQ